MEKDENENSCKAELNGKQPSFQTEAQVFEEIILQSKTDELSQVKDLQPEIDFNNDDKAKRLEDFELHRKLMEEQVKKIYIEFDFMAQLELKTNS